MSEEEGSANEHAPPSYPHIALQIFLTESFSDRSSVLRMTLEGAELSMTFEQLKHCSQQVLRDVLGMQAIRAVSTCSNGTAEECKSRELSQHSDQGASMAGVTWTKVVPKSSIPAWPAGMSPAELKHDAVVAASVQVCAFTQAFATQSDDRFSLVMAEKEDDFNDKKNWFTDESTALESLLVNFGDTIDLWVAPSHKLPPPRIVCNISNTKTAMDLYGKPYTQYDITVELAGLEWVVERRYSDFDRLHTQLLEQDDTEMGFIAKDLLPHLPRKTLTVSLALRDEVVLTRKQKLQRYLSALMAFPQSQANRHVLSFLGVVNSARHESTQYRADVPRSVIHVSKVRQELRWGDVVLFKCSNTFSHLQRTVTGAEWDHVGLVVKSTYGRNLDLLEATGEGVTVYPLVGRLRAYAFNQFTKYMAVRRLQFDRSVDTFQKMAEFVNQVDGKPYGFSPVKLFAKPSKDGGDVTDAESEVASSGERKDHQSFFCSELVAAALKHMGLIGPNYPASYFWPGSFARGGEVDAALLPHALYGDEIIVDCRYLEIGKAVSDKKEEVKFRPSQVVVDPDFVVGTAEQA